MCGIVGLMHRDRSRPVPRTVINGMCAAIRHRGPDDVGIFLNGRVGLGMRRLSIIDLAGGNQPIFNEDRSVVLILNGEIYNYRQLRRDLETRGHIFRTKSDTETVVHLYEEFGPDCVSRLRGMFAFALWDQRVETLTLARDRFGIKPLYVISAPWGIAFASELKALVAARLTTRTLDWNAIDMFMHVGYVPAPATPFDDVVKVEPGPVLTWTAQDGAQSRRYWDHPQNRRETPAQVEERVLDWLDRSVEAHLVSDVPVAAFLSGGIDSSAVVASMAKFQQSPHAFTARYFGSGAAATDETDLARALAKQYGIRLTIVDVRPEIQQVFEPIVRALDEPIADDSLIPTWFVSEAVARDYKVALTGIGGDELFGGYARHIGLLIGDYYNRVAPGAIRRAIARGVSGLHDFSWAEVKLNRIKRFASSTGESAPARYVDYMARISADYRDRLYTSEFRDALSGDPTREHFDRVYDGGGGPKGFNAGLYLDYKTFLADDLLALSDRLSMAHSLEIRVPFVDHELVEEVFPLPDHVKIGFPWKNKRLLRMAQRGRLPAGHMRAPKRGFVGPTAAWLRRELRPLLLDELSADRLRRLGYFDPTAVTSLMEDHFARRHNREGILFALLCFSTWHRIYVETGLCS